MQEPLSATVHALMRTRPLISNRANREADGAEAGSGRAYRLREADAGLAPDQQISGGFGLVIVGVMIVASDIVRGQ